MSEESANVVAALQRIWTEASGDAERCFGDDLLAVLVAESSPCQAQELLARRVDLPQLRSQLFVDEADGGEAEPAASMIRREATPMTRQAFLDAAGECARELCLLEDVSAAALYATLRLSEGVRTWLVEAGLSPDVLRQQILNDHDPVIAALIRAADEINARKWALIDAGDYPGAASYTDVFQHLSLVLNRACEVAGLPLRALRDAEQPREQATSANSDEPTKPK